MVPFWGKQLLARMALLAGSSAVLVLVIWFLSPGQASTALPDDRDAAAVPAPRADASREPITVPAGELSEGEARAIAEEAVGGQALQVDRQGAGSEARYTVEVRRADGKISRVTLNSSGSVQETTLVGSGAPARPDREPGGKAAEVRGTVRAIAVDARTITLLVKDKGQESEATFRLGAALRITGPKDATPTLAQIASGTRVRARRGAGDEIIELKVEKKERND